MNAPLGPPTPLLSVVVPTYQRAGALDRTLGVLHAQLQDAGVPYEVLVRDNASGDATPEVCLRWQERFGDRMQVTRNLQNLGGVVNLVTGLQEARGRWTWTVGDDDVLHPGLVREVVGRLQGEPDLRVLFLDFRGVEVDTGRVLTEHYFDPGAPRRLEDGRTAFAHHLEHDFGSVIFLTALVLRTDLAQDALRRWRHDLRNWALLAFVVGLVAADGPVRVTDRVLVDCTVGDSHWQREPGAWARASHHDIPLVFRGLARAGYPRPWCRRQGVRFVPRGVRRAAVLDHLRALRYSPTSLAVLPMLWFL